MAPINKPLTERSPALTIGFSQGRRAAQADTSSATLFKGAADTALLGIGVADKVIQSEIRKDLTDATDRIRGNFGVDDTLTVEQATGLPSEATDTGEAAVPAEVKTSEKRLRNLKTALDQGKVSETSYFSQLLAETKRVRARFPGYREQIDNVIQDVAGVDPANSLVRTLFRESQQRKSKAEASAIRTQQFIQRQVSAGKVTPDELRGLNSGTLSLNQYLGQLSGRESVNRAKAAAITSIKLENLEDAQSKRRASEAGNIVFSTALNDAISSSYNSVETRLQEATGNPQITVTGVLQAAAKAGKFSKEGFAEAQSLAGEVTVRLRQALIDHKIEYPNLDHSVAEKMVQDREAMVNQILLGSKEFPGVFEGEKRYNEHAAQSDVANFRRGLSPKMSSFLSLGATNPKLLELMVANADHHTQGNLNRLWGAHMDHSLGAVAGNLGFELGQMSRELSLEGVAPEGIVLAQNDLVDTMIGSLADIDPDSTAFHQLLNSALPEGDTELSQFAEDSKALYHQKLTSPKLFKDGLSERFETDEAARRSYVRKTAQTVHAAMRPAVNTLIEARESNPKLSISQRKDGTFVVSGQGDTSDPLGLGDVTTSVSNPIQNAVTELNRTWGQFVGALDKSKVPLSSPQSKALQHAILKKITTDVNLSKIGVTPPSEPLTVPEELDGVVSAGDVPEDGAEGGDVFNPFAETGAKLNAFFSRATEELGKLATIIGEDVNPVAQEAMRQLSKELEDVGPVLKKFGAQGRAPIRGIGVEEDERIVDDIDNIGRAFNATAPEGDPPSAEARAESARRKRIKQVTRDFIDEFPGFRSILLSGQTE